MFSPHVLSFKRLNYSPCSRALHIARGVRNCPKPCPRGRAAQFTVKGGTRRRPGIPKPPLDSRWSDCPLGFSR